MAGQPGRLQTTFNSLELGPRLHERSEIKYFQTGLARAENIEALPQGGFAVRQGLRHVGNLLSTAARLIDFRANDGRVFDVVYGAATAQAWGQTALAASFAHPYTEAQVRAIDWAQQLDTLVTFHPDVVPQRVLFNPAALTFANAAAPIVNLQNYDYGATYTNGVAAQWELEFIGVGAATVFVMTVNGQETEGILFTDITTARGRIETALTALGTIGPGFTVTVVSGKIRITFSGAENLGDKWAVSARAVNDADAAIVSFKRVTGVDPGEPVISATRGWPRCGVFYQQRLLMGGFKSLPAAWIASISGEYFNFDTRVKDANGAFLVLLDAPGGEEVRRIVNNQFLLVLTSGTNYWVAGSQDGLSKTTPPKHVPASDHGVAAGVPVVQNEGAAVYIHSSGDFVGELRYTDVDGNYKALDISLLAYHLISGATDAEEAGSASGEHAGDRQRRRFSPPVHDAARAGHYRLRAGGERLQLRLRLLQRAQRNVGDFRAQWKPPPGAVRAGPVAGRGGELHQCASLRHGHGAFAPQWRQRVGAGRWPCFRALYRHGRADHPADPRCFRHRGHLASAGGHHAAAAARTRRGRRREAQGPHSHAENRRRGHDLHCHPGQWRQAL
jgi:hypothetical protein